MWPRFYGWWSWSEKGPPGIPTHIRSQAQHSGASHKARLGKCNIVLFTCQRHGIISWQAPSVSILRARGIHHHSGKVVLDIDISFLSSLTPPTHALQRYPLAKTHVPKVPSTVLPCNPSHTLSLASAYCACKTATPYMDDSWPCAETSWLELRVQQKHQQDSVVGIVAYRASTEAMARLQHALAKAHDISQDVRV